MKEIRLARIKSGFFEWYNSNAMLASFIRKIYRASYHFFFAIWQVSKSLSLYGHYDLRRYYIINEKEAVYVLIPKVASSSILRNLLFSIGRSEIEYTSLHSILFHNNGNLNNKYKAYYKFTFVRNPFDRLVSCYKDKVAKPDKEGAIPYSFQTPWPYSIPQPSSFADFVKTISKIPDCLADSHFKSQYSILAQKMFWQDKLLLDYIGKFEDLEHDWKVLAQKIGFEPHLEHHNSTKQVDYVSSDYRTYYTPELAALVYKRYQKDFKYFGYTNAYQELMDFIEQRPTLQERGTPK